MLRNRSLQVKMIKDADMATDEVEDFDFEDKVAIVGRQIRGTLLMIGGGIVVYIAADTLRQVIVEQMKK